MDRRLDSETIRAVVAEYEAGATARQLSAAYGIARSTLISLLRRHGVAIRHSRLTEAEKAEILRLYESGVSQVEIADRFGRHKSVVWHALERAGVMGRRSAAEAAT